MPNRILRELLRGRGAHVDPLAAISGIDAELAGRSLAGTEHTIWQLVWHMNYWMDYELRSITGPEAAYPEHAAESWPVESRPPTEAAWAAEVARYRDQLDRLAEAARHAITSGLGARVVHPKRGETVQDVLWQMVAHNSYHSGQVALLRRAFGAWPPVEGGDSW